MIYSKEVKNVMRKVLVLLFVLNFYFILLAETNGVFDEGLFNNGLYFKTLPNGFSYCLKKDTKVPWCSVIVGVRTGSVDEGKYLGAGISHFVEHLFFKGTKIRKAGDIGRQIRDLGGELNGFTSYERTVFLFNVPSSGVTKAIEIMADAVKNIAFREEEVKKEQLVIEKEINMNLDNEQRRFFNKLNEVFFTRTPYRYPVIGYKDMFLKLKREDLVDYYHKRYVAENMCLVVVGSFEVKEVANTIEKYFSDMPKRAVFQTLVNIDRKYPSGRYVYLDKNAKLNKVSIAFPIPNIYSKDYVALKVLSFYLSGTETSVLDSTLKEKEHLVNMIYPYMMVGKLPGYFSINFSTSKDKIEKAITRIKELLKEIKEGKINLAEFQKAKTNLIADYKYEMQDVYSTALTLLNGWLDFGDVLHYKKFQKSIESVSWKDIEKVAKKYLDFSKALVFIQVNDEKMLPVLKGESEKISDSELKIYKLKNGVEILVKRQNTDLFSLSLISDTGVLAEEKEGEGAVCLPLLFENTKGYKKGYIKNYFDKIAARYKYYHGNNLDVINLTIPDLNKVSKSLKMIFDVISKPKFLEKDFKFVVENLKFQAKMKYSDIFKQAFYNMRKLVYKGFSGYDKANFPTVSSLNKIKLQDVKNYYKKFINPKNLKVVLVGKVDNKILSKVKRMFSTLQVGKELQYPKSKGANIGVKKVDKIKGKIQAVLLKVFPGASIKTPREIAKLNIISTALSGLGSVFFEELRSKKSLAYSVGMFPLIFRDTGLLVFYILTVPSRVDEADKGFDEVLANVLENGLKKEEFERAKRQMISSLISRTQDITNYAEEIGINYDFYGSKDYPKDAIEVYKSITLDEVNQALKKYFSVKPTVYILEGEK